MTKKANLESKYIFTGYKNKVESYIADFDIFFIPSMYEDPFPRVVIESMALSKPIIGYRIGGIGETIDDGINGYSFNLKDNNLIEKIIELIEDKELRLKMSFESRKKSVNQYDSRVIASKIISEIKSLRSWSFVAYFEAYSDQVEFFSYWSFDKFSVSFGNFFCKINK